MNRKQRRATKTRPMSRQGMKGCLSRMLDAVIRPNAALIARLTTAPAPGVCCAVFEPDASLTAEAARDVGWDGEHHVFLLADEHRERIAVGCDEAGDVVTARWMRDRAREGRVFVMMHSATLLMNIGPDGFSLEPGSTDAEWMN